MKTDYLIYIFAILTFIIFCNVANSSAIEKIQLSALPSSVQLKIHETAEIAFENMEEFSEGITVESIYGPIYKIITPNDLYLFLFEIDSFLFRGTMEAILYDPNTQQVTPESQTLHCNKPNQISFVDIDQDNVAEIVDIENTHCGTVCDWDTTHFYKIQPDMSFKSIFNLTTRSEGYCDRVICETLQEIKNISKNRIEVFVYVSIPDQDKILIGEIYYEKKNDTSSFAVVSYKVINQEYKSDVEWVAGIDNS